MLTCKATFATGSANHPWDEVGLFNAATAGTMLYRFVPAARLVKTASIMETVTASRHNFTARPEGSMAFTIPDQSAAPLSPLQAGIYSSDLGMSALEARGFAVISGCAVAQRGAGAAMSVDVAAGSVSLGGSVVAVAAQNVAVGANAGGNPRLDLVTVNASGTAVVTAGTAAAAPVEPAIPATSVPLAQVYVPSGAASILTANVGDRRFVNPALPYVSVQAAAFGAVGDGVALDSPAIALAVAAAGVGGVVVLQPGKIYLVDTEIAPLTGQTFVMYGAKIDRKAQVSQATATAITTTGNQSVTVVTGSAFRVGQFVSVVNGASYDPAMHQITAIAGNVLSLATAFTVAFPSGGTVFTCGTVFGVRAAGTAPGVRLFGGEIDGARASFSAGIKWDLFQEVYLSSDRAVVRDVYVHDAVCEGVYMGGVGVLIDHCWVENTGGNGVHLSGATDPIIQNCSVKSTNLLGIGPGHEDGAVIASNSVLHTKIVGTYIDTTPLAGIGSWDSDDDSWLEVVGCTITNCSGNAFSGAVAAGVKVGRVTFFACQFLTNGTFLLNQTNSGETADARPYRILVGGCLFEDTPISLDRSGEALFSGNVFFASTTGGVLVALSNATQFVTLDGNSFRGGAHGIFVDSGSADIKVSNNRLRGQDNHAVWIVAHGGNVQVAGNQITTEVGGNAAFIGIEVANATVVDGNQIRMGSGATGIKCPAGAAGQSGALVIGNRVEVPATKVTISTPAASQKNIITLNWLSSAFTDSGANTVGTNYALIP